LEVFMGDNELNKIGTNLEEDNEVKATDKNILSENAEDAEVRTAESIKNTETKTAESSESEEVKNQVGATSTDSEDNLKENSEKKKNTWKIAAVIFAVVVFVVGIIVGSCTKKNSNTAAVSNSSGNVNGDASASDGNTADDGTVDDTTNISDSDIDSSANENTSTGEDNSNSLENDGSNADDSSQTSADGGQSSNSSSTAESDDGLSATISTTGSWGEDVVYTQLSIVVANNSTDNLEGWTVEINVGDNAAVDSGWCGEFSIEDGVLTITNVDFNSIIYAGGNCELGVILTGITGDLSASVEAGGVYVEPTY
jgi:hypothetical protein